MVFTAIIDFIFLPLKGLVALLPSAIVQTVSTVSPPLILSYGANFFPMDLLWLVVSMFFAWYSVFMAWAIIEWIYKKIPGVS